MGTFKARLLTYLFAFGLIAGAIIGAILYYVFPAFFPNWFFEISVFFLLIESIIIWLVDGVSRKEDSSRKMVNIYLIAKIMKIFASIIFVAIYAVSVKEGLKNFILIFMAFYFVYTGIETFLFSRIERRIKEKNDSI